MPEHPYHHGNLRAALLDAAERTLRERGAEQISLRDLARRVGVSHGAPSRHFRDRQALLEALASAGFDRLGDEIATAVAGAGEDFEAQMRAVAAGYVRFAVEEAALLELMFTVKLGGPDGGSDGGPDGGSGPGAKVPERPYILLAELIRRGQESGRLEPGDPERLQLLVVATFQGVAGLVGSGRVPQDRIDPLIADATALFVRPPRTS